jgi:hypothetical protein
MNREIRPNGRKRVSAMDSYSIFDHVVILKKRNEEMDWMPLMENEEENFEGFDLSLLRKNMGKYNDANVPNGYYRMRIDNV